MEVTNRLFFDFETYIPWEFRSENALRTIVSPILVSGVPYFFGYFLNFIYNGWYLLIAPKIQLVMLSLSIDVIGYRIHQKFVNEAAESNLATKDDVSRFSSGETLLRLFSTSWSVLVFYSRPFSNTLEAFCLVYSLGVYLLCDTGVMKRCLLGFLLAFGVFTRFTFIAFFLPIGISLLMDSYYISRRQSIQTDTDSDRGDSGSTICSFVVALSQCVIGSVLGTILNISMDSIYYGGNFTITPLNNALYNMKSENLAKHGLHPRYLHLVVNLPMLCGPLALYIYYHGARNLLRSNSAVDKRWVKSTRKTIYQYQSFDINTLLVSCVCSGLGILSLAPHQEPRFLLPLVFPVLLYCSINIDREKQRKSKIKMCNSSRRWQIVWLLFNAALFTLFGVFHQAGVLRALNYASTTSIANGRPPGFNFFSHLHATTIHAC